MKTIMIIGAGKGQIPLIEAAKKEGYYSIVCDINPSAVGAPLADEFLPVSTKDRDGLLIAAKSRHIDGIVANSEYAMCDVAYIANQMDLVGNPENAVEILSSKSGFRTIQKTEGLFTPVFLEDASIEQILTENETVPYPIVIKPDKSSGTRSVATITDPREDDAIRKAIYSARTVSRNGKAIAEEFIPMPTRTVIEGEIFLHNREILWDGLFNTVRSQNLPMIPMTYVFPLNEEERRIFRLKEALSKAFCTAGIVHGEYNIEMFFTVDDEPFLIELNPRQGGTVCSRILWD